MYSDQNLLSNPTKVDLITLVREVSSIENPTIITCRYEYYELLKTKDPHTIYIIIDPKGPIRAYYGTCPIVGHDIRSKYLVGFVPERPDLYVLWHVQTVDDHQVLHEICRYDNPMKAINAMHIYSCAGSNSSIHIKLYDMILHYINKDIALHQLIAGMFVAFNYSGDPRFQDMISTISTYIMYESNLQTNPDLPSRFKSELSRLKRSSSNSLFNEYYEIYDIILKCNFFKGDAYDLDKNEFIDLSKPISDICNIFYWSITQNNR